MPKQTPLNAAHRKLGGKMVDFAGWDMPVQYAGVVAEHEAVRTAVGLFDVSHMGEIEFRGRDALETANRLITNDLAKAADGQAVYAGLLNEKGGFVDDVVAYKFSPEHIFICVNASNADKDFEWMKAHSGRDCQPINRSADYAQIAVQGPKAFALVQRLTNRPLQPVATYRFTSGKVAGVEAIISRTGYTGEDGFEIFVAPDDAEALWRTLMEAGGPKGLRPCGLAARDTLRLEARMALYGNDIDEEHTPLEAGLGWIVKLDKGDFLGRPALAEQKARGVERKLAGFELLDRGIARHGYPVYFEGKETGPVTSGTHAPYLKKSIGLTYLPARAAAVGTEIAVGIRGRPTRAG